MGVFRTSSGNVPCGLFSRMHAGVSQTENSTFEIVGQRFLLRYIQLVFSEGKHYKCLATSG